jgi:hypothetical protein
LPYLHVCGQVGVVVIERCNDIELDLHNDALPQVVFRSNLNQQLQQLNLGSTERVQNWVRFWDKSEVLILYIHTSIEKKSHPVTKFAIFRQAKQPIPDTTILTICTLVSLLNSQWKQQFYTGVKCFHTTILFNH